MATRTIRVSLWSGFFLAIAVALALSARPLWLWISTESELVIQDGVALHFRVLRWGSQAGERHGPFVARWDDQLMSGEYRRGEPEGFWRVEEASSGRIHTEAVLFDPFEKTGSRSVELLGFRVRVTLVPQDCVEFTIEGTEFTLESGFSLVARHGAEGVWVSGGSVFERGFRSGSEGILLRTDGSLAKIVSGVMRTEFDEQSIIVRQAVFFDGEHNTEIYGPPWVHPISGAMDWDDVRPQTKDSVR